ncbi:uncharacterized protein LOC113238582 isoform X2 [Hyposmocoma kahamanoa]|uniref:uncharacterized protein LOC113238582 isoform X2 n=1 Tax=Hyposmocoma kahamanoa TaxID=1477025 RepID=UPI000E6D9E20|nr:uncharacterized protein LOC113238582 isoform X2 [Hyposmocoma kahamanoa]
MAAGLGGAAGGVLALEVCAPLLLLCWLCCWPADDHSETSSSGKPPRKPVVLHGRSSRRQSSDLFGKRVGSSAASLHLPSTSGHSKQSLKSHRSHEEIPRRRQSQHLDTKDEDPRYHSAPSVIDEVIHRRDWERSTKDLYIPLKPDIQVQQDSDDSPEAPCAEPESSSIECKSEERLSVTCKKHYANIKSSKHRNKKELARDNEKDTDATESSSFYIGDIKNDDCTIQNDAGQTVATSEKVKSVYKAKDAKQSFNELIKSKDRSNVDQDSANDFARLEGFKTKMFDIDADLYLDELDRSGARHYMESRTSLYPCVSTSPFPPASVAYLKT